MELNQEKKDIIDLDGNVLVTANPGTGKTLLLAHKYIDLIKKGKKPEDILCLTFTEKAKREMEDRITKAINKEGLSLDLSKLNVFTFHSYALENIDESNIISTNLLRYTIFNYLKENEILNYGDNYLLTDIVPKLENSISYLKSFGILPENINLEKVKQNIQASDKYSKEEIDKFAEYFVDIFKHYEDTKCKSGVDYVDLLIQFLKLKEIKIYDYVLVDELQDVNTLEAQIAIKSGKKFFAVGDKKQAIFGFQGGSILNFNLFKDATHSVLSENFRSTNQILNYAKEYFTSRTKDESNKDELKDLNNAEGVEGEVPKIIETERDTLFPTACKLAQSLEGETAILTRTNYQINNLAKELEARGIEFSSTFFSASAEAKTHIIEFLKGVFSTNIQIVKNSMFTPFFPYSLQEVFPIAENKWIKLPELIEELPVFKKIRDSTKTVEDVNKLFNEIIIPICVSYGKEYLSAAISVQKAYQEALAILPNKTIDAFASYLSAADLTSSASEKTKKLNLVTIHKSKGLQFDNVIYIPSKTNNKTNYQDEIVEIILKLNNISAEEEIEEENLRVNFVALTRAKSKLFVITDKAQDYIQSSAELGTVEISETPEPDLQERKKRAFDLFVNGRFEEAKVLLKENKQWIREFVANHFGSLPNTSFSSLPESAYDYLKTNILNIRSISFATNLGSEVHAAAQNLAEGKEYKIGPDAEPFVENVKTLLAEIKKEYPELVSVENKIQLPLNLIGFNSDLQFKGYIDAVFKNSNGEYLIVDWKTDKTSDYASKHKQQLETYRRALAAKENIPENKIKVAIAYVGLRSRINTGKIEFLLEKKQPASSAFNTVSKRVDRLLTWIKNPDAFFQDLIEEGVDDMLWKSVIEEYKKE